MFGPLLLLFGKLSLWEYMVIRLLWLHPLWTFTAQSGNLDFTKLQEKRMSDTAGNNRLHCSCNVHASLFYLSVALISQSKKLVVKKLSFFGLQSGRFQLEINRFPQSLFHLVQKFWFLKLPKAVQCGNVIWYPKPHETVHTFYVGSFTSSRRAEGPVHWLDVYTNAPHTYILCSLWERHLLDAYNIYKMQDLLGCTYHNVLEIEDAWTVPGNAVPE